MKHAARSDRGKIRELNEDSFRIVENCPGVPAAFIIADGMGGHNSGEVASKSAVDFTAEYMLSNPALFSSEETITDAIREAMTKANEAVYSESMADMANSGMGTTLTIAVVLNSKLFIGHIGDSRVYLIRNGRIERITTDHSYIEELIKNGSISRDEAFKHPGRNVLTRALGCFEAVETDTYVCDMMDGDCFILCTDGLSGELGDDEILETAAGIEDPETICGKLVDKANEKGGEDNITVIAIRYDNR